MINRFIPLPFLGHCRRRLATCVMVGLIPLLSMGSARAVAVDSELLLLVDVSEDLTDFNWITQSIANSFRSSEVLDSIQSGHSESVAVSLVFWAGAGNSQQVPWVNINNSEGANDFASSVESVAKEFADSVEADTPQSNNNNQPALRTAIAETPIYFGDETGGTANSYESSVQIVTIIGGRTPLNNNSSAAVLQARKGALDSGVDIINAIAINQGASYYDSVIAPIPVITPIEDGTLQSSITTYITSTLSPVPEPSTTLSLLVACGFIFIRRR